MKHMRHIAKKVDDWTRVEAKFMSHYAHQLTDEIMKCDTDNQLKNLIISSILDKYMFFYTKSNRPHKITKLMLELLDEKDFHFQSTSSKNNLLDQSLDHLVKGSGLFPTLWKVEKIWGYGTAVDLLAYLYDEYQDFEPNDQHVSWINKYKNLYLLQGKPWRN